MEIIKNGKYAGKLLTFRCASCGCVWKARADECEWEQTPADLREPVMDCPECGTEAEPDYNQTETTKAEAEEVLTHLKAIWTWTATGRKIKDAESAEIRRWTDRAIKLILTMKEGGVK